MNTFSTRLLLAGLVAGALATAGCSGGDSPFYSPQQLGAEKYVVSGTMVDSITNAPLKGSVTLNATDKNGNKVILYTDSINRTPVTTLNVANGQITFFVDKFAAGPVTLVVNAKAESAKYLQSSATVTINNSNTYYISIKLVDTTAAASGVTTATAAGTAVNGALSAALSTSGISIPAGAVLKTAAGTPLTGAVTLQVTDFVVPTGAAVMNDATAGTTTTLDMFPGGLGNIVLAGAPAGTNQGSFASAGYAAITLVDAAGNIAASSSTPFTIRLDIPAGTVHPDTGAAIKVGDSIPIWTYNETAATWKAETDAAGAQKMGVVKSDAAGLYIDFTTNHFSYWNLDWFYSDTCTGTLTFKNDAAALPLTLKATFANGGGYLYSGYKASGDTTATVVRIPKGKKLNLFAISGTDVVKSLKDVDWCATPNQTIDYTAPANLKPVAVTVTVKEVCTKDTKVTAPVPTTPITYSGPNSGSGTTNTSGVAVVNILPGDNYIFGSFDQRTNTYVTNPAQNITTATSVAINILTDKICPQTTGTTGTTGGGTGTNF